MTLWDDIFAQLRSLALAALPTGTKVIEGRQGKPGISEPHIVIMPIPSLKMEGQSSDILIGEDLQKTMDWTGEVDIRQLGGDGDLLRLFLQETESETVKDHLVTVSFLSNTEIQDLSFQEGDHWVLEHRLAVRITVCTRRVDTVGTIKELSGVGTFTGSVKTHSVPIDISA